MTSALPVRKQDLPPPGGYKPIAYKRVPAKQFFSGYTMFAGYIGITAFAMYLYAKQHKQITKDRIEMRSCKMAIFPMLMAERDRAYMKQLRLNRDAECELMKNVPGWEVGTWYGEKVYNQLKPGALIEPIFHEYYAHSGRWEWLQRAHLKLKT